VKAATFIAYCTVSLTFIAYCTISLTFIAYCTISLTFIAYCTVSLTFIAYCTISLTFSTGVLHLIQINHKPDATVFQFIILTFIYSSTCFGRFPVHHQELIDCSGSLWFHLRIVVKPEAATAVIELLMMDGKTPETC
jgi:amino acid transporter